MFGLRRSVSALAASRSRGSSALCGKVRAFSADSVAAPAAKALQEILGDTKPRLGMVLGSGMGGVADSIEDAVTISYADIPGFPVSTVHGHSGELVVGKLNGVDVACLRGRVHLYEGGDPQLVRVPVYTLKLLGCEAVLLTAAVGSMRPEVGPGELVCVTDHINMQGRNPLVGPNDPIGTRFPSLHELYDPAMRQSLHKCAAEEEVALHDGVYVATLGPVFETPAEINAFRILGGDVVGMSTVTEAVCARHCDMRVAAMSIVVNYASGMTAGHITHEETLHFGKVAEQNVTKLVKSFVADMDSWA